MPDISTVKSVLWHEHELMDHMREEKTHHNAMSCQHLKADVLGHHRHLSQQHKIMSKEHERVTDHSHTMIT